MACCVLVVPYVVLSNSRGVGIVVGGVVLVDYVVAVVVVVWYGGRRCISIHLCGDGGHITHRSVVSHGEVCVCLVVHNGRGFRRLG